MTGARAIGIIKYLSAYYKYYITEETSVFVTYKDYLTTLKDEYVDAVIKDIINHEVFFPKIATINKYYTSHVQKKGKYLGNFKEKISCDICDGVGGIMVTNKDDYDNFYRCTKCEAGKRYNEKIPPIESYIDLDDYNKRKKSKEGAVPIRDIQNKIKGLIS
jgi:hypothetical protein